MRGSTQALTNLVSIVQEVRLEHSSPCINCIALVYVLTLPTVLGVCANTGETAHIFDHEWGHGLDFNDLTFGVSQPSGEGIAGMHVYHERPWRKLLFGLHTNLLSLLYLFVPSDVYAALRLGTSCIGPGFRRDGAVCRNGFGAGATTCLTCTGVRDIDYTAHLSNTPHTLTWLFLNCFNGGSFSK